MLDTLKVRYGWNEAVYDGEHVRTDVGKKRVQFWHDKRLMKWHIDWRDSCSVTPYVIMDRMLRTTEGAAFIAVENSYVTVHDVIEEESRQVGFEKNWGMLLGSMIVCGRKQTVKKERNQLDYDKLLDLASGLSAEQTNQLNGLIREAAKRTKNAKKLIRDDEVEWPTMDRLQTADQGKQVFGMLVVNGSNQEPVVGYESLIRFLNHWLVSHGQESMHALLDEVNEQAELTVEEQKALLAEALEVRELNPLFDLIATDERNGVEERIERVSKRWDETRTLVVSLANWLDKKVKT